MADTTLGKSRELLATVCFRIFAFNFFVLGAGLLWTLRFVVDSNTRTVITTASVSSLGISVLILMSTRTLARMYRERYELRARQAPQS